MKMNLKKIFVIDSILSLGLGIMKAYLVPIIESDMDKIYEKEISKSIINGDRSAEHPYIIDEETAPMFSQYLEEKVKRVISLLQVSNKVSLYGVLSGKTHSNQTNGVYWNYTKNVPSTVSNGNIWMKKARTDVINICLVFISNYLIDTFKGNIDKGLIHVKYNTLYQNQRYSYSLLEVCSNYPVAKEPSSYYGARSYRR